MSATVSRPLLRWSSARDCGRKAIYEATGAPARARTEREQRILFRGKRIGRDYGELLSINHNTRADHKKFVKARAWAEEKGHGYYGAGKVWCEKKVVWPLGVGHMDIWLPEPATGVEVLSSAHATVEMIHSKKLQLVGYIEHDPEASNGVVVVLDPSSLDEDRHIVSKHQAGYDDLVEEMRARIAQVQEWDATGDMPARVCGKPSDAMGHFCTFSETCFEDWQRPDLPVVITEEVVTLARQLYEIEQLDRAVAGNKQDKTGVQHVLEDEGIDGALAYLAKPENRTAASVKAVKETVKTALIEALGHAPEDFLHDPGEYEVGPLVLKRNLVQRAGYTVQPAEYETLTVKRVSDAPLPGRDYGDEAPWTDEDLGPA